MFAARCIGVSLAVFVLLYVFLSLLVSRGWKLMRRTLQPTSARSAADLLFILRVLPLGLSLFVTVAFTLPSFLLLEPRSTGEAIGTAPLALGLCCLVLLGAGVVRAALAQWRASRALVAWLSGSALMESQIKESGTAVPIFRIGNDAPSLTVAGVCAPKVLVSEAAIAALTSRELRTALRHEIAHAIRYDNLRKLLFRLSAFPAMAELEHAWSEETEMAADDAAVSTFPDALDLAAALIKVSRLGSVESCGELTMALLHSSTALSARVHRLVAWDQVQKPQSHARWFYILPAAAAILIAAVTTYGSVLTQMHAVTEWLVR
ncbi:MAG TPA: M56 family metallopeptidase [Terriglobales bacterium]|jgi:Zn-dependent protease with chaperone function|nr:M56 family metallopeptidase [Terriglobales bacterium]